MTQTSDIVAKLWNLCHVLRDGGISYHQYVTELTLLLFLKMAKETTKEHLGCPRTVGGMTSSRCRRAATSSTRTRTCC
jgi:hypothetical protein